MINTEINTGYQKEPQDKGLMHSKITLKSPILTTLKVMGKYNNGQSLPEP